VNDYVLGALKKVVTEEQYIQLVGRGGRKFFGSKYSKRD